MKIAVIGAGSFTFGHSMLSQVILENKLAGAELALMDLDKEIVELMQRVGQRMAEQTGVTTRVTAHTNRQTALSDAEYVVCCASQWALNMPPQLTISSSAADPATVTAAVCPRP